MSPTIFRWKGFRFYFFSREEQRIDIHVRDANGQAQFWIEPDVVLENNYGIEETALAEIQSIIKQRKQEIVDAWYEHFSD